MTKHDREVERIKAKLRAERIQKDVASKMKKNPDVWGRIMRGQSEFKPEYIKELKRLKLI